MEERNKIKLEDLTKNITDLNEFSHASIDDLKTQIKKLWENLGVIMFYLHVNDPDFRNFTDNVLKDETLIKKVKNKD